MKKVSETDKRIQLLAATNRYNVKQNYLPLHVKNFFEISISTSYKQHNVFVT